MLDYFFAVPYYKSHIDSSQYNKTKLIEDITHNYNIDPKRNRWDNESDIHHSYNDDNNENFKKINYTFLVPLYNQHIKNFLDAYFDVKIKYKFHIVNYTCFGKGQHMTPHVHTGSCFSGVHYVKFNSVEHDSTLYWNPLTRSSYAESFFPNSMRDAHSYNTLKHSWLSKVYSFNITEDDIVITPSTLKHSVPISKSEELRMVVAFHLDIVN